MRSKLLVSSLAVATVTALSYSALVAATCPQQFPVFLDASRCENRFIKYSMGWDAIPDVHTCLNFWNEFKTNFTQKPYGTTWATKPPEPTFFTGPIQPNTCIWIPSNNMYRAWTETLPHLDSSPYYWTSVSITAPIRACEFSF